MKPTESVVFLFSAGKDSIVAGDLFRKLHVGPIRWVYFYYVKGLSFVDSIIQYYEKKWKITVEQRPCFETLSIELQRDLSTRKNHVSPAEVELSIKKEFGVEWIVDGVKRNDSLSRRGMLKDCVGPLDEKAKKWHPIIDWTDKMVNSYIRLKRLPVPITYNYGMRRSLWIPNVDHMLWMKDKFPDDYRKILDAIPEMEIALVKKFGKMATS